MKAFATGYKTVFEELPFRSCTPSIGQVPTDLEGTYFRSGPAMFSAGSIVPPKTSIVKPKSPPVPDGTDTDRMVLHPFEGDGAILGITFSGGQVSTRYRYVRTPGFTNERKKGVRLYNGLDSTRQLGPSAAPVALGNDFPLPLFRHHLQPGLNRNRKNNSNTRCVYWGRRLLTLWDGGQPFKLDGLALSTEGRTRLGGAIPKEEDPFGAKMVYDPVKNRALFHSFGAMQTELRLYEFNSDFRLVQAYSSAKLQGASLLNDFAATENYAVFVQPNVVVANPIKFLTNKDPGSVLRAEGGPAILHLIPRIGSAKPAKSFQIPVDRLSEANLQFCNAYEDVNDSVIVDAIRSDPTSVTGTDAVSWPWGGSLESYRAVASAKSLWRYTISTHTGVISKRLLYDGHCFFGVVNQSFSTRQHKYIYMNIGGTGTKAAPPQGIAKVDCESGQRTQLWMPESYEFCGEPMYAPRQNSSNPEEDSGYILSVLFNGKKGESEIVLLEASNVSKGPIARIPLGISVPHGYFGCFTAAEEAKWPSEEIQRRSKLADKIESRGSMWNEVKSDFSGLGLRFDGTSASR
jgi:all-trans-8'-apo-beta-carotenal 15,15'-oxygenase